MNAQQLLQEISDYCRQAGIAESTFGRRAVNDGKLASRLRYGGRVTLETVERVHTFIRTNGGPADQAGAPQPINGARMMVTPPRVMPAAPAGQVDPQQN